MLRATTDLMVDVLVGDRRARRACSAILRGALRRASARSRSLVVRGRRRRACCKTLRRQVLGRGGDGRRGLILFFLPWLDRSPVQVDPLPPGLAQDRLRRVRRRSSWCSATSASQPPSAAGNYVAQLGTLVYFGFFLLMPWWSRLGTFKPVPDRVTFARALTEPHEPPA